MQNPIEQTPRLLEATAKAAEGTSDNQSLIILITGFVVVFLVLLLLIGYWKSALVLLRQRFRKCQEEQS